jgi:CRISPR-associated endonuclease/helicase Cas3
MSAPSIQLSDCWAKTDPVTGRPAMTVRDHSLIVGAVAEEVLRRLPPACSGLPPEGAASLAALHDIGKITPGFLRKCVQSKFHSIAGAQSCEPNHARVSQAFLASLPEMQDAQGNPLDWTLAADGHHGRYFWPCAIKTFGRRFGPRVTEGQCSWPRELRELLLGEIKAAFGPLPSEPVAAGARVHWLTGLVTFCDWIGSNTDWFPLPAGETMADQAELEASRRLAIGALDHIGWHRREPKPGLGFSQLFSTPGFSPRPLQQSLVNLADQRGLYIVEAPMGMGKTEAALAAAYRRWAEGAERGLYFALPTQLTSNRIHERVSGFLENIIADQSIRALAHGNAWLREDRIQSFRPAVTDDAPGPDDPGDATDACRWFASSRRALLAPFGTGTIDQALMARIAAKHSALRLFALSGKVVVIDEVHSYDPYTAKLVDHLVSWLLETGCTVIILSATLTARRRAQLVEAAGGSEPSPTPDAYPLITKVTAGTTSHHPVEDPSICETKVVLDHRDSSSPELYQQIADAARAGACVLVIRNTVALAQETYRQVKSAACGDDLKIGLLHSRFPHFRREENEAGWMRRLGKDQSQRPGAGCILVATQVVEQSVDIDADLLVTDAAPIDLLLQRLGRLHRHARPRPEGFGHPVCWILHPQVDWGSDVKAVKEALGPVAHVYPPFALYQTERIWKDRPFVTLPVEIRALLEATDFIPDNLPAGAASFRDELAKVTANMLNAGSRQDPFHQATQDDTEGAQTRWNMQPSALLVLLREPPRRQGRQITVTPLHGEPVTFTDGFFSYDLAKALHENAARIPAHVVRAAFGQQLEWLRQHVNDAVLAVCRDSTSTLEIVGCETHPYRIDYSREEGIRYQRVSSPERRYFEEEYDSWF